MGFILKDTDTFYSSSCHAHIRQKNNDQAKQMKFHCRIKTPHPAYEQLHGVLLI